MSSFLTNAVVSASIIVATLASSAPEAETYGRGFNFGSGPAALPVEVLKKAGASLLNFRNTGIGIMEHTNLDMNAGTHPGVPATPLQDMLLSTELKLRSAIDIPDDYDVMFMHGGATGHFAAVPMNFLGEEGACADYVDQGLWSSKSFVEAQKYGDVQQSLAFKGEGPPQWSEWSKKIRPCAVYVHTVMCETAQGVEILSDPNAASGWTGPPVVVDATSTLLSRPIDVSAYGMIYASGGKNFPHGVTTLIVRRSFLEATKKMPITPAISDYRASAGALRPIASQFESRPNTPPIWGTYLLWEILDHLEEQGGVSRQQALQEHRVLKLYRAIDESNGFYINKVHPSARSRMNVIFNLQTKELDAQFIAEAAQLPEPLLYVFGHPTSGGVRVTTYNWITTESIDHMYDFMIAFAKKVGTGNEL